MHIHTPIIRRPKFRCPQLSASVSDLAPLAGPRLLIRPLRWDLAAMSLNRPSVSIRILSPIPWAGCEKNTLCLDCGLTSTILSRHSSHTFHISHKGASTRTPIPPALPNLHAVIDVPRTKHSSSCNRLFRIFSRNHPSHKPPWSP